MSGLQLLAPLGLLGLLAVPLVVLLHMRHTTPLVRPVPTLRFWAAAQPEQTERTRLRRPPLSLLLLLHLLIVALIAVALARPAAARAWGNLGLRTEPRHLIVLLDGSTSMAAVDTASGRTRFEEARDRARERLAELREGDVATVLLLGTRTETLEATDAAALAALRDRLEDVAPPGGRADLNEALDLSKDLLLPGLEDRVLLISDGALSADPGVVAGVGAPIELARVGAGAGAASANLAITDLAARAAPGTPDQALLYVRLFNFADETVTAPVVLLADGIEAGRREETLAPGQAVELSWPAPPGTRDVTVAVEVDDALSADDTASLVLRQADEADLGLRVLLVSDTSTTLRRALEALAGAEVTVEPSDAPVTGATRDGYDLVVYENVAPPADALPNAPLLVVHPLPGDLFSSQGTMPRPTITHFRVQDPLLRGVDLAGVTFGETPVYALDGTQTELVGAEDGPLLFRGELQGRPLVVLAFDLAQSNLPSRVAFPILIGNIAATLAPSSLPAAIPLGDPLVYRPRAGTATVRVVPPEGEALDLPLAADGTAPGEPVDAASVDQDPAAGAAGNADRLREITFADTGRPGEYRVTELDAAGAERGGGRFVVNAGHVTESDLRARAELPVVLATARAGAGGGSRTNLADLWPLLAAAALAALALEWLVLLVPRRVFGRRPFMGHRPAAVGHR